MTAAKKTSSRDKSLKSLAPWHAEGVSRAAWFRRQHENRGRDPLLPMLVTLWRAIRAGNHLQAEAVFGRMLDLDLSSAPAADRRTVEHALRSAIEMARKGRQRDGAIQVAL
jgi:hypothetical protein